MKCEINGIKYKQVYEPPRLSKSMAHIFLIAQTMGAPISNFVNDPRLDIDNLVKEYELIQLKTSNLSRRQRRSVCYQFERRFQKIQEQETTE